MKRFGKVFVVVMVILVTVPVFAQGVRLRRFRNRQVRIERAFNRLDINKDGRITREEWRRRQRAFDRLDMNKDGAITIDELRNVRRRRATN